MVKQKKRNLEQKQDGIEKSIKILEEQIANTHVTDSQKLWPELEKKRFELEANALNSLVLIKIQNDVLLYQNFQMHDIRLEE